MFLETAESVVNKQIATAIDNLDVGFIDCDIENNSLKLKKNFCDTKKKVLLPSESWQSGRLRQS